MKRAGKAPLGVFLLLRVQISTGTRMTRMYLTEKRTWSRNRDTAWKGSYRSMEAVMHSFSSEFPDIILERCVQ